MANGVVPPLLRNLRAGIQAPAAGSAYATMIDALRDFLDQLAGARLDDRNAAELEKAFRDQGARLQAFQVDEPARMFGQVENVPGAGQVMRPAFRVEHQDDHSVRATANFGAYFLGYNGAAHGGAIAALFDDVLSIPANTNIASIARTAYLHVNYRSIARIGAELQVDATLVSIDGRKRLIRGELRDGGTLCADAEALFLELRPGQQ